MSGLETAFYIVGIVYIGLSLLILIAIVVALLVIRSKVVSLENMVKDKLHAVSNFADRAADVVDTVKKITNRKSH